MAPDLHLVTVYETDSLVEAALLSRRLLDEGIDNLIEGAYRPGLDRDERWWQTAQVRVALERVDDADVIVGEFVSEAPG